MTAKSYRSGFLNFILFGLLCFFQPLTYGANYGENLIKNGNAEAGSFSSTGAPVAVPSWTTSANFTVVNYNAPGGFPKSTDSGPPDAGNQFFAGGNASISTATQEIDLTANAADINVGTGNVSYDLSGWLGGYLTDGDNASLGVQFFNGSSLLGIDSIGPVTAADRNNVTGLFRRFKSSLVPANATRVVVSLTMTRESGAGTFNDGYADSLSLVLRKPMVVTNTADSGPGSLRAAIVAGNTITFDPGVFAASTPRVISLLTALPLLNSNMTIVGPGANVLTVQRSTAANTPSFGVFTVSNGTTSGPIVTFTGLTISNGRQSSGLGGGVSCFRSTVTLQNCAITGNMAFIAGGVYSDGNLSLLNCRVTANTCSGYVGGIYSFIGGTLTLTSCTISGNSSSGSYGGILNNGGLTTIDKCTISSNSAAVSGGGVGNLDGTMTLTNSTLSGNSSSGVGGGIYNQNSQAPVNLTLSNCTLNGNSATDGGGIYNDVARGSVANVTFDNTIFKNGATGGNISNTKGTITSRGYNMSNDNGGGFLDQTGDRINTDPMLGPLQDNGGPTFTHALLPGSLAIDKGNSPLTTDQRGFPRPIDDPNSANGGGNNSDIGAFEVVGLVANVSTRLFAGKDDNALFEGFIIQGPAGSTKKLIVRGLGPFLGNFQITGFLDNPTLDIFQGNTNIAMNNDWRTTQIGGIITADQSQEIAASGFAPSVERESTLIANLAPGSYTAVVRGLGNTDGIALVDAFDLSTASAAKVVNFSTRGLVQPGDKLLTAGFIIQNGSVRAVIRAIGPSLIGPPFNIANALPDTTLQLRNQNGDLMQENDDWQTDPAQKTELEATGLQPTNAKEAALVRTIPPGQYSAQVRGKPESTGVGVVEIYFIQ